MVYKQNHKQTDLRGATLCDVILYALVKPITNQEM
jgi:hypothetical protein